MAKRKRKEEKGIENKYNNILDVENLSREEIKAEKEKIQSKADKILRSKKRERALRLGLLIIMLFLIVLYIILKVLFTEGAFTISLDQNFAKKSGIIIYEHAKHKESKRILKAKKLDFMDNIAEEWIPKGVENVGEGSHNGENYMAYTFYIENQGQDIINYWYHLVIDDVIKDVDRAIRIKIFLNGKEEKYAKIANDGNPEPGTKPFYSKDFVCIEQRKDFKPR